MDILAIVENYTQLKKKNGKEYVGPCPGCGGEDRFMVWPDKERWHCRRCGKSGNTVMFLHQFGGKTCPEAHEAVGQACSNAGCPAWEGCRLGAKTNGMPVRRNQARSLEAPVQHERQDFTPDKPATPKEKWQKQAEALIEKAHAALLGNADQLSYLTGRGLPMEAVKMYRLGYLAENRYPKREQWGLPSEFKEAGGIKKMFLPEGILIPFFDSSGQPHRLRIRRSSPRPGDPRYYWVPGSGNDVPVIGDPAARGVVVVESDLDSLMVHWQCRELDVCTLPLGTVAAKPKDAAFTVCQRALAILVSLDFEPRTNEKTGLPENPGGEASKWWLQQFRRAIRWPVPSAKDPGEYFEAGGDIRAWVMAGLPPVFSLPKEIPKPAPAPATEKATQPETDHIVGRTINGHQYVIAPAAAAQQMRQQYPEAVVITTAELQHMQGMSREEAELVLLAKKEFGGTVIHNRPLEPGEYADLVQAKKPEAAPLPPEPVQEPLGF